MYTPSDKTGAQVARTFCYHSPHGNQDERYEQTQAEQTQANCIVTYTGAIFDGMAGTGPIVAEDLAHALSNICRFGGHTREFYSVAEHSVRVSRIVAPFYALWGLLHDAAEVYLGDIVRPIKQLPCSGAMVAAEERILYRLVIGLGLTWPMPAAVHEADEILLATEWRDLMGDRACYRPTHKPLAERIAPWTPKVAEAAWLMRFKNLRPKHDPDGLPTSAASQQ